MYYFLVLCCKQFREKEILEKFYYKIPEKYKNLIISRQNLLNLRNAIAHYNFKDFESNKHSYLDALTLFEYHIGHNVAGIKEFPKYENKPSIKTILLAIKNARPDLFEININKDDEIEYFYNKHRLLLDLCDEMALYNGYKINELPSPWSILRQMYSIKQGNENNSSNTSQLSLFDVINARK